jgi:hypothetical protein
MSDESERANADQFHDQLHEMQWTLTDWHLRDDPISFSLGLVDQRFDDVEALLGEALA